MGSGAVAVISAAKLGAVESIGLGINSVVQLYESVRLRRVKMWAWADQSTPATGIVSISTISLTFEGGALGVQGNHVTLSDMTVSTSQPAVIDYKLNDNMQAGQWQTTDTSVGSQALFQVSGPPNTVMDLWLDVKATRNLRSTGNQTTTSAVAALGVYYYLPLDNNAGGTGSSASKIINDPALITIV